VVLCVLVIVRCGGVRCCGFHVVFSDRGFCFCGFLLFLALRLSATVSNHGRFVLFRFLVFVACLLILCCCYVFGSVSGFFLGVAGIVGGCSSWVLC